MTPTMAHILDVLDHGGALLAKTFTGLSPAIWLHHPDHGPMEAVTLETASRLRNGGFIAPAGVSEATWGPTELGRAKLLEYLENGGPLPDGLVGMDRKPRRRNG